MKKKIKLWFYTKLLGYESRFGCDTAYGYLNVWVVHKKGKYKIINNS